MKEKEFLRARRKLYALITKTHKQLTALHNKYVKHWPEFVRRAKRTDFKANSSKALWTLNADGRFSVMFVAGKLVRVNKNEFPNYLQDEIHNMFTLEPCDYVVCSKKEAKTPYVKPTKSCEVL